MSESGHDHDATIESEAESTTASANVRMFATQDIDATLLEYQTFQLVNIYSGTKPMNRNIQLLICFLAFQCSAFWCNFAQCMDGDYVKGETGESIREFVDLIHERLGFSGVVSGSVRGYVSEIRRLPSIDGAIFILSNHEDPMPLTLIQNGVKRILFGKPVDTAVPGAPDQKLLARVEGEYVDNKNRKLMIALS